MTTDWSGFMLYAEKIIRDVDKTLTDHPAAKTFDEREALSIKTKLDEAVVALQNVGMWVEERIERR